MRASLECAISSTIIKSRASITHKEPKSLSKQFEYVTISLARRRLRVRRHEIALHECRLRWFFMALRSLSDEMDREHAKPSARRLPSYFNRETFLVSTILRDHKSVQLQWSLLPLALPACLHNRSRSNSSDNSSLVNCLLHVLFSYWKSCSRWWCFLCLRKKGSNAGELHRRNDEISFAIRVKLRLELD